MDSTPQQFRAFFVCVCCCVRNIGFLFMASIRKNSRNSTKITNTFGLLEGSKANRWVWVTLGSFLCRPHILSWYGTQHPPPHFVLYLGNADKDICLLKATEISVLSIEWRLQATQRSNYSPPRLFEIDFILSPGTATTGFCYHNLADLAKIIN